MLFFVRKRLNPLPHGLPARFRREKHHTQPQPVAHDESVPFLMQHCQEGRGQRRGEILNCYTTASYWEN